MKTLAMHLTDIVQNSICANSTLTEISFVESKSKNLIVITISDNGVGMSASTLAQATSPFFTTRTTRRVGLGISLLQQNALQAKGTFSLSSVQNVGTNLVTSFQLNHVDTPPVGDLATSIALLAASNPKIDFVYTHQTDISDYHFDTRDVKKELGDIPISEIAVYSIIKEMISTNLSEIRNQQQTQFRHEQSEIVG